ALRVLKSLFPSFCAGMLDFSTTALGWGLKRSWATAVGPNHALKAKALSMQRGPALPMNVAIDVTIALMCPCLRDFKCLPIMPLCGQFIAHVHNFLFKVSL
ncbi:MAG: hypothetical protein EB002_14065, partial [Betaproteobacteria bacterium]|nr:hypothetical protein [Betaproteobacteria bacterium]